MSVTFEEVIKYIKKDKGVGENERPPILIPGGKNYPPNFRNQISLNKQVILIVHEMKRGDTIIYNNVEFQIRESLDLENRIGSFTFETHEDVEKILQQLGEYFQQNIDSTQVIRRQQGHLKNETVFVLFLPVVEQSFFNERS